MVHNRQAPLSTPFTTTIITTPGPPSLTGPWVDRVREQLDKQAPHAVTTSSGSHITLPEWYGSHTTGMIVPKTKVGGSQQMHLSGACVLSTHLWL